MVKMSATIHNAQGIHCRPSGVIFKACEGYSGNIVLASKEMEVRVTSIMDIIALGLFKGDSVVIKVSGENEAGMCEKLVDLFEKKFDFPPKKNEERL
jgi:phosphocarrier protein